MLIMCGPKRRDYCSYGWTQSLMFNTKKFLFGLWHLHKVTTTRNKKRNTVLSISLRFKKRPMKIPLKKIKFSKLISSTLSENVFRNATGGL